MSSRKNKTDVKVQFSKTVFRKSLVFVQAVEEAKGHPIPLSETQGANISSFFSYLLIPSSHIVIMTNFEPFSLSHLKRKLYCI